MPVQVTRAPATARFNINRGATRPGLFLPVRLDPPKGEKGRSIILPGIGMMEVSELSEILASVNEKHGRNYTLADIERQVEERIKGTYNKKPSMRWSEREHAWIVDGQVMRE